MEITPTIAALIGGGCGAAISSLISVFGQWLTRRSDERKHLLDLCFKTAVTNWERDSELAKDKSSAGQRVSVSPLDLYIIHMIALTKLSNLSHEESLVEWERLVDKSRKAFEAAKLKQPN